MKAAQTEVLRKLTDPSAALRNKTLKSLVHARGRWFKREEELKVLFESLFRTFWLADSSMQKVTLQGIVAVIEDLVSQTDGHPVFPLFWEVFNNNWPGIDRFRLNKYYTLVEAILSRLSDVNMTLTSDFVLRRMSEVKRPSGLVIRMADYIVRKIQDECIEESLREQLCVDVVGMISKFPLLPPFESVTEAICECVKSSPTIIERVKSTTVEILGQEKLPSGSRPILATILQHVSLPPAL